MGKAMIIYGADFSANAVENISEAWINDFSDNYGSVAVYGPGGAQYAAWNHIQLNSILEGKTITKVRGIPKAAGDYNFYKVSQNPGTVTSLGEPIATITITSDDIDKLTTFEFDTPITIEEGEYLVHGDYNLPDGGNFLWLNGRDTGSPQLYYLIGTNQVGPSDAIYNVFDFCYLEW